MTQSDPADAAHATGPRGGVARPFTSGSRTLLEAEPRSGWVRTPEQAFSEQSLTRRLIGPATRWREQEPTLRLWMWLAPLLTAVLGGILRFVRLGEPRSLVFDETYYVKDAYSMLQSGYERNWSKEANPAFNVGDTSQLLTTPEYVVHPPLGKWMIAWGIDLFGQPSTFGWRFSAALVGTISILLIALIAQKLFSSLTLGVVAGVLTAVDGHHIVMSRTSILDIFLMFWVLLAFGALLMDRDDGRRRLARRIAALPRNAYGAPEAAALEFGPWLGWRWWRFAAAIAMGAATGVKWSALFFLAAFGIIMVLWDMNARRTAGIRRWMLAGVIKDGIPAFFIYLSTALLVYLSTWTGWLLSSDAYFRNWAPSHPGEGVSWLPESLRSLWHYHEQAFSYHQGLSASHPYKASAWTWLVVGRPTSFYFQAEACPQAPELKCAEAVNSLGNPLLWWSAIIALLVVLFYWAGRRDWRAGAILVGMVGGFLPWFMYPERTTFYFYAISFEPFLVLALCYALGLVLGSRSEPPWRRRAGLLVVAVFLAAVVLVSAFFLPIWTAETIPYDAWRLRMWLPSWI